MSSLDEIAAELYGAPPESFVGRRDEYVKQAKAAGDRDLARELGRLRRPTQSAWLVNRLARDERPALGELLGMGEEYTAALTERDGSRLKELTSRRRDLEAQLVARAGELGAESGVAPSDEILGEVRATLDAMVSDPDVAEQVRAGRLVKAAGTSLGGATASPRATSTRKPGKASAGRGEAARPAANEADAREAARAARDRAAADLAERTSEAEQANAEYEQLSERLERLRADVQALAQDVRVAQQNAVRAERRRANAERDLKKLDAEAD